MPAAATVDEYLAACPDDQRRALQLLRDAIRAAVPEATEGIAYSMPGYRLGGRYLLGFAATKSGCSLYIGRAPVLASMHDRGLADELVPYRLWKGTINFTPDRPLPH